MEKSDTIKEIKQCCSTRDVLWYLVFTGFAVNYMVRTNLNIAIVSMVKVRPQNNDSLTSECLEKNEIINGTTAPVTLSSLNSFTTNISRHLPTATSGSIRWEPEKFDWDEKEQGNVLGSFFWMHWATQIPGGILASRYGTKLVFGLANVAGVITGCAIPWMAKKGANYLIFTRMVQGFLIGFAWPAMHHLTAKWIPPNERSQFVTAYLGSSVGAAITYPMCGYIIDRWGWELVFYVCGFLGFSWFTAWWLLVYNTPSEHPRITDNEKEYIITSLGESVSHEKAPIPWGNLLTSVPVLMNIIAQVGGVWGLFTLMTTGPTYFKFIHGWDIKATGLLTGMPHLFRTLVAYIVGQIADYLLRTNKMVRTNVRKMATAICCCVQGVFMMSLAYTGCDKQAAILFFTLAVAAHGAVSTGPLASAVDISPNYASIILGMVNTGVTLTGFVTPVIVGYLTFQNQTVVQWQKVYWIASTVMCTCGILYCMFAKSELQPWNSPQTEKSGPESEMMIIKKIKDKSDTETKVLYDIQDERNKQDESKRG